MRDVQDNPLVSQFPTKANAFTRVDRSATMDDNPRLNKPTENHTQVDGEVKVEPAFVREQPKPLTSSNILSKKSKPSFARDHPSPSPSPPSGMAPFVVPSSSTPPRSFSNVPSPWHALAATSGAPTPSIESGPTMRGNSPHLGYPFERLNIGGSWSGANLFSETENKEVPSGSSTGSKTGPVSAPGGPSTGISQETLARYRSQAGKTPLEEPGFKLNLTMPPPRMGSPSKPIKSSKLQPISPSVLQPMLNQSKTLVLDVRPPSSFQPSHVVSSHSLPIPSTLLRRPAFTLSKLLQMLTPPSMAEVAKWKDMNDIVLVDQDSGSAAEGSVLKGLANKFEREGYAGKLWFVKGGYTALRSSGCHLEGEDSEVQMGPSDETGLRAGRLGRLAFEQESTGANCGNLLLTTNTSAFTFGTNPSDVNIPQAHNASPMTSRSSTSSKTARLQPANPFFDNIRQNLELSHGGITERIPLNLPAETVRRASEMPNWMAELVQMDSKDSMDKLARQFYEIELGEQKRLQNVMEWHSKDSGVFLGAEAGMGGKLGREEQHTKDAQEVERLAAWQGFEGFREDYFPFSITAGVERGSKNRYKNIWPYDFSRVRLNSPTDDNSDYINASFVQPRGTARRYIVTQGPLDATYRDFWTLVWEQDVRVIVMLTKQFEGGLLKCGNYWQGRTYGSLHLEMVSQSGGEDAVDKSGESGFNFGSHSHSISSTEATNIKRVFLLSHKDQPSEPPRRIIQIQCVSWPDIDVPADPEIHLDLIKDVDAAVDEVSADAKERDDDRQNKPPVLVHCSAGVGRSGSFIIVDAILDGLRRELFPSRPKAPAIITGGSSGSRSSASESTKSVSFLTPGTADSIPEAIPENVPAETPVPSSSNLSAGDYMGAKDFAGDRMELDSPDKATSRGGFNFGTGDHQLPSDTRFSEWREDRRPSLASISSERASFEKLLSEAVRLNENIRPITASRDRHRSPSPLSSMSDPVASVLEGMRVQRMSLVQSLRQYLFVHRAIIHHYLSMLDEAKKQPPSQSDTEGTDPVFESMDRTTSASSTSISTSTSTHTDEDTHIKRRASPTDLDIEDEGNEEAEFGMSRGGSGLSKRPSFKKMRATGVVEGISLAPSSTTGSPSSNNGVIGSSSPRSSRKK